MKKLIYFFVFCVLGMMACSDDKELGRLEDLKVDYILPQGGNSEADVRIQQMYNNWGCYVLYDYTDLDFYYDLSQSYFYTLPNPEEVDEAIHWLDENFFNRYPDKFLKKYLPYRILLTDSLYTINSSTQLPKLTQWSISNQTLAIGYCNTNIASAPNMRFYLSFYLWSYWTRDMNMITPPAEFVALTDYETQPTANNETAALERGFMTNLSQGYSWAAYNWSGTDDKVKEDFYAYICSMIFYRTSQQHEYELSFPLIKQKHDVIVKYFKDNFGLDILHAYLNP